MDRPRLVIKCSSPRPWVLRQFPTRSRSAASTPCTGVGPFDRLGRRTFLTYDVRMRERQRPPASMLARLLRERQILRRPQRKT